MTKKTTAKAAKLSVSLSEEMLQWIEANKPIFGSVSGAITRGIEALMKDVTENPQEYTVKPVLPKRPSRSK